MDKNLSHKNSKKRRKLKNKAIREKNEEIQSYISLNGVNIPEQLIKLLSDLDWALKNRFHGTNWRN